MDVSQLEDLTPALFRILDVRKNVEGVEGYKTENCCDSFNCKKAIEGAF